MNKKNIGIACIVLGVGILIFKILGELGLLHGLSHVLYPIRMFLNLIMDAFSGVFGFIFRNLFIIALIFIGYLLIKSSNRPTRNDYEHRLYRNLDDRKLFGVCSGIADYLNLDATIVRVIAILLGLSSFGLVFWIYIILALVLPGAHLGY